MRLYVGKPTYPSEIWWHMNLARKHMRKYRVDATLTDRNLRIPQGRMCQKEMYNA